MNLLSQGADWLERQRHQYMTANVHYQRGDKSLTLQATIGRTVFEMPDDYGHLIRIESRDFLIRTCDLILDGQVTTPQPGDRIVEGNFIYEVMSPTNEPEWRYSDLNRQTIRIHTKETGINHE